MIAHDAVLRFVDPMAEALLARQPVPRKALFIDRDGIVNVDRGYVHTPAQTQWVPGIFELLCAAYAAGFLPVVVTNQAGIARGLYDESAFIDYTRWMHGVFSQHGTPLLATFFCPHHPQAGVGHYLCDCACRKPRPGMILAAAEAFKIDLTRSVLIGDKPTDIEAAVAAGIGRTKLVADAAPQLPALLNIFVPEGVR